MLIPQKTMETSDSDLSLRGSFSYKNDNINIVIIDVNILLRIERIDQNVARIYFVNSHDNAIRIPAGVILRDVINNTNVPRVTLNGAESYVITWASNYTLLYNGDEILNLENQKQQSMRVPIEYDTDKIEQ